jgi:erythromycin esterase-like protein
LVGFSSYQGSVIAGSSWEATMKKMRVPQAIEGSFEEILHSESKENRLLVFDNSKALERSNEVLGHRAIGVVYDPARERWNYVPSKVFQRYDAMIYLDETNALHPLKIDPDGHKVPETFPFGV